MSKYLMYTHDVFDNHRHSQASRMNGNVRYTTNRRCRAAPQQFHSSTSNTSCTTFHARKSRTASRNARDRSADLPASSLRSSCSAMDNHTLRSRLDASRRRPDRSDSRTAPAGPLRTPNNDRSTSRRRRRVISSCKDLPAPDVSAAAPRKDLEIKQCNDRFFFPPGNVYLRLVFI